MRVLFAFVLCTIFIFCGVNWFLLPLFPMARQVIPALTIWHSAGASALLMIAILFVGGNK